MKSILPAATILLPIVICCTPKHEENIQFECHEIQHVDELIAPIPLLDPQAVFLIQDHLIISDMFDSKMATVVSTRSPFTLERIISRGKGPHELLKLSEIFYSKKLSYIGITDGIQRDYSVYDYTQGLELSERTFRSVFSLRDIPQIMSFVPYDEGFIANGNFENGNMFCFINHSGEIQSTFGLFPGDKTDAGTKGFAMRNETIIAIDPQEKSFVAAGVYSDWLAFYELKEGNAFLSKEYFEREAEVIAESKSVSGATYVSLTETEKTIRGYEALFPGEECLYALYIGMPSNLMGTSEKKSYILLFSYNGTFLYGFCVDEVLKSFVIDEETQKGYALTFSREENSKLVVFDVPHF